MRSPLRPAPLKTPNLSNSVIIAHLVLLGVFCSGYFVAHERLPESWRVAGAPFSYMAGVFGAGLMIVPYAFSIGKRGGALSSPRGWLFAHAVCGFWGFALLVVHSTGNLDQLPALLMILGLFVLLQGSWSRIVVARKISATFGSRPEAFLHRLPVDRIALREIIGEKIALLEKLEPSASEALFSPTLWHWIRAPRLTRSYVSLCRREREIVSAHFTVNPVLRFWRVVHMSAAYLLLAGMVLHIVLVTFFAGYVSGGENIHWWHVTEWTFDWIPLGG
ncbi:MAG: hypothetical protein OXE85_08435 [Roseovarius sp.]|nr:hypothetical protein [Roseovarius sp.]